MTQGASSRVSILRTTLIATVLALLLSMLGSTPQAQALTVAFQELSTIMDGGVPNVGNLQARMGSTPAAMFSGGGSENIAVVARAALYLWEGNPHNNWLWNYYNLQFDSGSPYFLNREVFSGVYTQAIVGVTIAVRQHALSQGQTALANSAGRFLRVYWAFLSLSAIDSGPTTTNTFTRCGNQSWSPANEGWGYNLGIVGSRTATPIGGCGGPFFHHGMQPQLLAMALQHPNRSITGSLNRSPGFYGGPRAAVLAAGYTLAGNGTVNLQSMSVPSTVFGLTAAQRTLLFNFIATNGRNGNLPQVVALLNNQGVRSNITIVKLSGAHTRVTSWWGTYNGIGNPPGDAGGGPWFIVQARGLALNTWFVSRSTHNQGRPEGLMVWRDGNNICAQANPPLPEMCLPMGSGNYSYRVLLRPNGPVIQYDGPI